MSGTVFDVTLLVAIVVIAVVAVVAPRRAAAVASFLVFGVVLAVLWARLDAPDIALAEAALGGGIAGALLVDVLGSRTARARSGVRWPVLASAIVLGAAMTVALVAIVRELPDERSPLADDIVGAIPRTGVEHPVTAVLLNYRSYDTLLEIAVLAFAAIGAVGLARRPIAGPRPATPVVRALAVVLLPVLVLVAVWLLVAGTSRPGGAFQAGALLAAGLIIAHLAGVRSAGPRGRVGTIAVVGGLLAFIAVAVATAALGNGWLELEPALAGSIILGVETVLAASIAAGLAVIFLANRADEAPDQPVEASSTGSSGAGS